MVDDKKELVTILACYLKGNHEIILWKSHLLHSLYGSSCFLSYSQLPARRTLWFQIDLYVLRGGQVLHRTGR